MINSPGATGPAALQCIRNVWRMADGRALGKLFYRTGAPRHQILGLARGRMPLFAICHGRKWKSSCVPVSERLGDVRWDLAKRVARTGRYALIGRTG